MDKFNDILNFQVIKIKRMNNKDKFCKGEIKGQHIEPAKGWLLHQGLILEPHNPG